MLSLRLLLVVIGIAIIVAVYFFGVAKRRRDSRVTFPRRFGNREFPDVILDHDEEDAEGDAVEEYEIVAVRTRPAVNLDVDERVATDTDTYTDEHDSGDDEPDGGAGQAAARAEHPPAVASAVSRPGRTTAAVPGTAPREAIPAARAPATDAPRLPPERLPRRFVLPPEEEVIDDLPKVRNDTLVEDEPDNARRGADQLDLFGADTPAPPPRSRRRPRGNEEDAAGTAAAKPDDGLIHLFVRAHEGKPFGGPELVRALNAVGLRFGDMSVFHHYGAGELRCDRPVFSAANMFEPGTFDLARIEAFRTAGVVLFMQLPAPLEGPVAFELMLNAAQRLAELSGGELYATPEATLDPPAIARLRNRAARFGHAG